MEPSAFLTLDTLKTLAGQVLAVGMLTQAVKSAVPTLSTYLLRLVCVAAGIALQGVLSWHAGMGAPAYALATFNGMLVATSAMKLAELVKGDAAPKA